MDVNLIEKVKAAITDAVTEKVKEQTTQELAEKLTAYLAAQPNPKGAIKVTLLGEGKDGFILQIKL